MILHIPTHDQLEAVADAVRSRETEARARYEIHKFHWGTGAPFFSEATSAFWEAIRSGRFMLNRCSACRHVHFPPRVVCPKCWQEDTAEPVETPGLGKLVTFTELHVVSPALKELTPIRMAVVDLEEGVRILTWLRGPGAEGTAVGDPCRIVVETVLDRPWFVAHRVE